MWRVQLGCAAQPRSDRLMLILEKRRCVDGLPVKPQFSVVQFNSMSIQHLLSNSDGL